MASVEGQSRKAGLLLREAGYESESEGRMKPYRQGEGGTAGNHDGEAKDGPDGNVLQVYRAAASAWESGQCHILGGTHTNRCMCDVPYQEAMPRFPLGYRKSWVSIKGLTLCLDRWLS